LIFYLIYQRNTKFILYLVYLMVMVGLQILSVPVKILEYAVTKKLLKVYMLIYISILIGYIKFKSGKKLIRQ
jgi:hypothetical protein